MRMVKPEDLKKGDIIANPDEPHKSFYMFIEMIIRDDRSKMKVARVYNFPFGTETEMIFNRDIDDIDTDEEFVLDSDEIKLLNLGK